MNKTIEITVDPQGRSRVETKGYTGPSCRADSLPYEEALGAIQAEHLTAAFHQVQEPIPRIQQSS